MFKKSALFTQSRTILLKKRHLFVLAFVLALGFFLRIYKLGQEGLWNDEIMTLEVCRLPWSGIGPETVKRVVPPVYFYLLHGWMGFWGDSAVSIRSLSVIFGMFALVMVYKVARLISGPDVALGSVFLVAVSPFHIAYSQDARMYTVFLFFGLLSFYFFVLKLRTWKMENIVGYILATVFLIYTHFQGTFIILAQNLYVGWMCWRYKKLLDYRSWFFSQAVLIFLSIPAFLILINPQTSFKKDGYLPHLMRMDMDLPIRLLTSYSGSKTVCCVLVFLVFFGLLRMILHKTVSRLLTPPFPLLIIWLFSCAVLPLLISMTVRNIFFQRYTIVASVAFYVLIVCMIGWLKNRFLIIMIAGILGVLSFQNILFYNKNKIVVSTWVEDEKFWK